MCKIYYKGNNLFNCTFKGVEVLKVFVFVKNCDFREANGLQAEPVSGRPLINYVLDAIIPLKPEKIIFLSGENTNFLCSCFPNEEYSGVSVEFIFNEKITADAFFGENDCLLLDSDTVYNLSFSDLFDFSSVTAFCKKSAETAFENKISIDFDGTVLKDNSFTEFGNNGGFVFSGLLFVPFQTFYDTLKDDIYFSSVYDMFNYFLNEDVKVKAAVFDGYSKKITGFPDFLSFQFDVLNGKYKSYHYDDGMHLDDKVYGNDYLLIPPVYIGKNVQIEKGSVIGPCVAVNSGTLISSDTKIKNSILLNNVYVSSFCNVNGAVLCEGVSVKMGSVVDKGAVILKNTIIAEKTVIKENEYVRKNNRISFINKNTKETENTDYDFSAMFLPVNISAFGCALATFYENSKIGIATDGEINSEALKNGLICGLVSCGSETYDLGKSFFSQIYYYTEFFDLKLGIFISGGENGTAVSIVNCDKKEFSLIDYKAVNEIIRLKNIRYASPDMCKEVRFIEGIKSLYCGKILKLFDGVKCRLNISVYSEDRQINECVRFCFKTLGIKNENDDLIFKINEKGTRLSAIEDSASFQHNSLISLARYYNFNSGTGVPLSFNEYGDAHFVKSDAEYNNYKIDALYECDAFFLAFEIIYILEKSKKSLSELLKNIPEYYKVKKIIELRSKPQVVAKNLLDKGFSKGKNGGLLYKKDGNTARVFLNSDGKSLKFIAEAVSAEVADEIFFSLENIIKSIDNDCK